MLLDLLSTSQRSPAECVIQVGSAGQEIEQLYPFLTELTVETGRFDPAVATLTFETRRDENGKWVVEDSGLLNTWDPITILAAFGDDEEEILRGYIRAIRPDHPNNGISTVKVECQDASFRLDRTQQNVTWGKEDQPTSDSLILSTILGPYGHTPDPDNGSGQSQITNLNQKDTDIKFLRSRAEFNGYELIFREGTVYFGPMRLDADPQPTIMLQAGTDTNCLSCSVAIDGHLPDAIAVDIPDDKGSAVNPVSATSNLPLLGNTPATSDNANLEPCVWKISGESGADQSRLQDLAQQKINEYDMQRIKAEGELDGTLYGHVLKPGLPVAVDGLGDQLAGVYYVDKVSHHFTSDGYQQKFSLLRNALGDNLDSVLSAPGPLAALL